MKVVLFTFRWVVFYLLVCSHFAFSQTHDLTPTQLMSPLKGGCSYGVEALSVRIQNVSGSVATGFDVSYSINGVLIASEAYSGALSAGGVSTFVFANTYDFSIPNGYEIEVVVSSVNDNNASNDTLIYFIASGAMQLPYYENFENHDGAWYTGGSNSSWVHGTPNKTGPPTGVITNAGEGAKCWVNGGLTGFYNQNENSYLYSPCFDFSNVQNPEIIFKFIVEVEPNWEKVTFQFSINNGSWSTYGNGSNPVNCNKQNWFNFGNSWSGRINSNCQSVGCGGASYCGSWSEARHCLTSPVDLSGQNNVRFRFAFSGGSLCEDEGFGIDSVVIREARADADFEVVSCSNGVVAFEDVSSCKTASNWLYGDGLTGSGVNPVHFYSQPGVYPVTLISTGACGAIDTIQKSVEIPEIRLPDDTISCGNSSVLLETLPGYDSYSWSTSANDTDYQLLVLAPGSYQLTVTEGECTQTESVEVYIYDSTLQTNFADGDTTFCQGQSVDLSVNSAAHTVYTWQDGTVDDHYVVSSPGIYWVESVDSCYTIRDSILVGVDEPPSVNIGADTIICDGENVLLSTDVIAGANYSWSTGSVGVSQVSVSNAGVYSVTVVDGACMVVDDMQLSTLPSPNVDLGLDTALCDDEKQLLLTLPLGNDSYLWNTGSTDNFIVVAQAGYYSVTSSLGMCTKSDTIKVDFGELASIDLKAQYQLCDNDVLQLGPFNNVDEYDWSFGSTDSIVNIRSAGRYSVELTNVCGVVADTFDVEVISFPEFELTKDTVLCLGDSIVLSLTADSIDFSILWNTGASSDSLPIDRGGYYEVEAVNECGTASKSLNVLDVVGSENPLFQDIYDCEGELHEIDALNRGGTYVWNTSDTSRTITISTPGYYEVEIERCGQKSSYGFNYIPTGFYSDDVFPNVVTPNNDGFNDVFKMKSFNEVEILSYDLKIFDRWGKLVFSSTSIKEHWDGTHQNGEEINDGSYFYLVNLKTTCGEQYLKGIVKVMR